MQNEYLNVDINNSKDLKEWFEQNGVVVTIVNEGKENEIILIGNRIELNGVPGVSCVGYPAYEEYLDGVKQMPITRLRWVATNYYLSTYF